MRMLPLVTFENVGNEIKTNLHLQITSLDKMINRADQQLYFFVRNGFLGCHQIGSGSRFDLNSNQRISLLNNKVNFRFEIAIIPF